MASSGLGSDHYEFRLSAHDFADFMPDLVWHLDEPLADPSCIPLYFVSKLAREHIKVVLSGEGADEILAGYGIYPKMLTVDRIHRNFPALGRIAGQFARVGGPERLRRYLRMAGQSLQ